jgi:hypothetical protein
MRYDDDKNDNVVNVFYKYLWLFHQTTVLGAARIKGSTDKSETYFENSQAGLEPGFPRI